VSKPADFFSIPAHYLEKDYNVLVRQKIVHALLGNVAGKRILDIGCGDGRVSLHLATNNELTLMDASEGMLELARKNTPPDVREKVTHILSSLEDAPLQDGSYDVIVAMGILAHLTSWKEAVQRLSKVVKAGGRIVIQISDSAHPLVRKQLKPMGERGYALNRIEFDSLVAECKKCGLTLQTEKKYGFTVRGMGMLSNKFLYAFTLATSRFKLFRKLTTEVIAVFQRN